MSCFILRPIAPTTTPYRKRSPRSSTTYGSPRPEAKWFWQEPIGTALSAIIAEDTRGYVEHAGYHPMVNYREKRAFQDFLCTLDISHISHIIRYPITSVIWITDLM